MIKFLLVGLGGALGSMLRYGIQRWLNDAQFPYGTLAVNIVGCFLIGLFAALSLRHFLSINHSVLLIAGFCGGFTTLSAFGLESLQLLQQQRWIVFFGYTVVTIVLGVISTFIGYKLIS